MTSKMVRHPWRRRWVSAAVVLVLAAGVAFVWLSPFGAGQAMLWLGLVRVAPPQAYSGPVCGEEGRPFAVPPAPDWEPGEPVTALQALYAADEELAADTPITFTFLYDLPPAANGVIADTGFAILIEGLEQVILYDAGLKADVLLANAKTLGKSLADVDALVISHTSEDHIEGITAFEGVPRRPIGYYPAGIERRDVSTIRAYTSETRPVTSARRLLRGVFTTGPAPGHPELALVIATPQGPVHLLSCGHIGRVPFLDQAAALTGRRVYLDIGGFCPLSGSPLDLQMVQWTEMRKRDPRYVAFCHCAPDGLRALAAETWPDRSVRFGAGTIITIPTGDPQAPIVTQ